MLMFANLQPAFIADIKYSGNDFDDGVSWLVERGFLEIRTERQPPFEYFLTDAGLRESEKLTPYL